MLRPSDVYKRIEDNWVSRVILDEVVIMPLCRSEEDIQYIYSISNQTGSRIWQLLDGRYSAKDIQEILKSEYQGQGEVIEREVLEFLRDILEVKLIKKIKEKAKKGKPQTTSQKPDKKKSYKTPKIAKVKMQPEQAVLSCCVINYTPKLFAPGGSNVCAQQAGCETGGPDGACADWVTYAFRTNSASVS